MDGHDAESGPVDPRVGSGPGWSVVLVVAWIVLGTAFLVIAVWLNAWHHERVGRSFAIAAVLTGWPLVVLHVVHGLVRRRVARVADGRTPRGSRITTTIPDGGGPGRTSALAVRAAVVPVVRGPVLAATATDTVAVLAVIDATASAAPAATRLGGLPAVPDGFAWPECAEHDEPMQFTAQIEHEDTLVSVFVCQFDPGSCASWDPTSGANAAFVFRGPDLDLAAAPTSPHGDPDDPDPASPPVLGPGLLLGIHPTAGDPGIALETAAAAGVVVAGQYGGDPDWIQEDETPEGMRFVASLEPGPLAFGFGDEGRAYVFSDGQRASVLWQCS